MKQETTYTWGRDGSAGAHHTGFLVLQRTHQLLLLELSLLLTFQSFSVFRVGLLSISGSVVRGCTGNGGLTVGCHGRGWRGDRGIQRGGNGSWGGNLGDNRWRGYAGNGVGDRLRFLRHLCLLLGLLRALEVGSINGELNGLGGGSSPQVIHSGLQSLLPSVKVHAGQLSVGRGLKVDIQALTLADEGTTISSEIENLLLTNLPDSLVDRLDIVWNTRNALDRTVISDDHVLHVLVPETKVNELFEEPGANNLELPSEDTTSVNIAGSKRSSG